MLFLVASLAVALTAVYSPKPLPPTLNEVSCKVPMSQSGDPVMSSRAASGCAAAVIAYDFALGPYHSSLWTLPEISQSLFFVALLCLILPKIKPPESLKRKLTLPRPLMLVPILVGAVSFGVFAYGETFNILYANSVRGYSEGNLIYWSYFRIDPQLPVHSVLGLAAASACFGVLMARRGLSEGVRSGAVFGAFWVTIAQMCLLAFDYKEMHTSVTAFSMGWTLFGFPLLSNWFVLIMALSLTSMSFVQLLSKKTGVRL
jgi:hypothetical protein